MKNFTNVYTQNKTLRFSLIPVGDTSKNIEKNGLLIEDNLRAENYKKIKPLLDDYHKYFIEKSLSHFKLDYTLLNEYYDLYASSNDIKKDTKFKNKFNTIKDKLRKAIANNFKAAEEFKLLGKKELVEKELLLWLKKSDNQKYKETKELIESFKGFTTYFTGYNTNRANMYVGEEKSTAIAYRIIDENLPLFINNINVYDKTLIALNNDEFICKYPELNGFLKNSKNTFNLEYFNQVLTQTGIENYNNIIGGFTLEGGIKFKGFNEYINLCQQATKEKLPKMKKLKKQILSDRISLSFLPDKFENDLEMIEAIKDFFDGINEFETSYSDIPVHVIYEIKNLINDINKYETDKIFIRNDNDSISTISQRIFADFSVIKHCIEDYYPELDDAYKNQLLKNNITKKSTDNKERFLKQEYFSIKLLQDAIDFANKNNIEYIKEAYTVTCIGDYFINIFITRNDGGNNFIEDLQTKYDEVVPLHEEIGQYNISKSDKDKIKVLLDVIKQLVWFYKPLKLKSDTYVGDQTFYATFDELYNYLNLSTILYDKVRNYLTQKPDDSKKYKLNFGIADLAKGWDINKEKERLCIILRKEELYYLGIYNNKNKPKTLKSKGDGDCYEKMEYKYFKDITTMIPKCSTQLIEVKEYFSQNDSDFKLFNKNFSEPLIITREIFLLNNLEYGGKKKFQKDYLKSTNDVEGYNNAVATWIEFCIRFLKSYKSTENYNLSPIMPYTQFKSVDAFYNEVNKLLYNISFIDVSTSYINKLVDENKLYLFQIYNKDFSPYSKGKENLHTMYFKALFDEENLKDVVYKLSGEAEIFFREKVIETTVTHPQGQPIALKNPYLLGESRTFDYDIIKDRRYGYEHFYFHVPMTLNFKADKSEGRTNINSMVSDYLMTNKDVNIIGIDRGERNLIYLSLINQNGDVLIDKMGRPIQYDLNTIVGSYNTKEGTTVEFKTPYHELLDEKEKKRKEQRQNWDVAENIKELKSGYLSQVVHKITKLMVEYNAIIVLEDLNSGFKNSRKKVEKGVYQQFEMALIKKLNYLVFKDIAPNETGGLYKALQLTDKFTSYKDMSNQNGFIFYVPAWNTSKIDPVTGFVDLLKPKYDNINNSKAFFKKFERISYNDKKDYFEFEFNYSKFTQKAEGAKLDWVVCTYGDVRYAWNKSLNQNHGGQERINVTQCMKKLFESYSIDYLRGKNIIESISLCDEVVMHRQLNRYLSIVLNMRYSNKEYDEDFILSPVADENGNIFCSKNASPALPQDADANGAYHIARKGLYVIKKLQETGKVDCKVTNKEWFNFVSNEDATATLLH